ncbi:putative ATP-grasp-modified RiPP [Amycolatopsis sp. NPDC047767]|uniref:putative ATP-grasp-modified RiPP n=1 Tax=Amycolatopsis sp. NPDC047767 TaxID=3156765 RepID=UPI0034519416
MTAVCEPAFANDPVATHSAQFPLGPLRERAGDDAPSAPHIRPWGLRWMQEGRVVGSEAPRGTYDPASQLAVDSDGRPLIQMGAPTANSVSNSDGDEGPSEDWTYDAVPDNPYTV